jgi:hypothetical protein
MLAALAQPTTNVKQNMYLNIGFLLILMASGRRPHRSVV